MFLAVISAPAANGTDRGRSLAIRNVTVVDATGAPPRPGQTAIIKEERVIALGAAEAVEIPPDARVIDGAGKFLIPGLWDMHMHLSYVSESALPLLIANGVTGVRDMGGDLEQIDRWREQIESEVLLGPKIFRAGLVVDGPRAEEGQFRLTVKTSGEARDAVRSLQQRGVDLIKVYHFLSRDAYFALADECKKAGIGFAGHIPNGVSPTEASNAGQRTIEHTSVIIQSLSLTKKEAGKDAKQLTLETMDALSGAEGEEIFYRFAENKTAHTPTLVVSRSFLLRSELAKQSDGRRRYVAAVTKKQWEKNNPVPENVSPERCASGVRCSQKSSTSSARCGVPE
ncbi:hypothetical protein BH20VER1_BH20VER1_17970 [soil metagenome]